VNFSKMGVIAALEDYGVAKYAQEFDMPENQVYQPKSRHLGGNCLGQLPELF
jgi:hypothetical protein